MRRYTVSICQKMELVHRTSSSQNLLAWMGVLLVLGNRTTINITLCSLRVTYMTLQFQHGSNLMIGCGDNGQKPSDRLEASICHKTTGV